MIARSLAALILALASAAASADPEPVAIPANDLSNSPGPLVAYLFEPAGAGRHPAVVMMHGCGGAYGRDGSLNARHRMWGEFLAAHGYVALMLDSFTARGVKEICTQKFSDRTLKESDRAGDAFAALAFLRSREDVDADRIALLGWSHGGGSVLSTVGRPAKAGSGFTAAIAFYPGCTSRAKSPRDFHPHAPLVILMGAADDWTPAAPCEALTAAVAARGEAMSIVTYPDTFHDFDNPGLAKKRVRSEVPNGVAPGRGVTVAPNAQAREDAKRRVLEFLAKSLPARE